MAEAQAGVIGFRARAAFHAAKTSARSAAMNSPEALARAAARRLVAAELDAARAVRATGERLDMLVQKLGAARARAASLSDRAFRTGDVHEDASRIKSQVAGLPDQIARAEAELAAALDAHETAKAALLRANSTVEDEPPVETEEPAADSGEPAADAGEPAAERRGRGRPRKGGEA